MTIKNLVDDDRAYGNMSFVVVVAFIAILLAGGMANILTIGVNIVFDIHNDQVDAGMATQQTADNLKFAKNTFTMLSILTIIGVLVWAKMHSGIESTTTDATLLLGSVVVMYLMAFLSMCLVLSFGMTLDIFTFVIDDVGLHDNLSESWDGVQDETIPVISLIYTVCQLPCIVGIFAFFMNAVRKTRGEEAATFSDYQMTGED